ncbi:MAG: helix-turn-helix domain-containing protein [Hyphomicrobiaceae bacterium]
MTHEPHDKDHVVSDSSGNVFADIGLPTDEKEMLKVKIAAAITNLLQKHDMTQAEAAKIIGVDQPKISNLVRGRLREFSVDRLLYYLVMLGFNVDIRISQATLNKRGRIRVAA